MFGFSAFADAPFASLSGASPLSPDIIESISTTESQSVSLLIHADLTESLSSSDAQGATNVLVGDVSESLSALAEQSNIANLVCSVLEAGNAVELIVGRGQFSVLINEVVYAIDSVTARDLWENISTTQTANWGAVSTT